MIPKGAGSIRSLHSLNTRPGSQKHSDILRRMYILACEEEHLKNKTEWLKRQKEQAKRRLSEIWRALSFLKARVEKKQEKMVEEGNPGKNFHRVTLKY